MNLYNKNRTWKVGAKMYVLDMMREFGYDCANSSARQTLEFYNKDQELVRIGYPNGLGVIHIQIKENGYRLGRLHAQADIKKALGLQS